ncbi:MAG TPA: hypothetical protein VFJ94_12810 [Intrasporangium sp.]|nr:hypothetical protein [Intrasporangium sp.]
MRSTRRSTTPARRSSTPCPDAPGSGSAGLIGRLVLVVALVLVGLVGGAGSALADEPGETHEGYLLVQQALAHLAHDPGPTGIEMAVEKADDALAAEDQKGVDLDGVKRAKVALESGRVDEARTLLQASITDAVRALPPARGNDTGTTVVLPEQPGRGSLDGQDWGFLVSSVVVLLLGLVLAVRFRPRDSVGELRRRLGSPGAGLPPSAAQGGRHR